MIRRIVAPLAATLLLALPAAASADTTVNFDGPEAADGDLIASQYVPQGVDFRPDKVPQGGTSAIPVITGNPFLKSSSSAHSPPNLVRLGYCGEFCNPVIVGSLATPSNYVQIYPGMLSSNISSRVILTVYGAGGVKLATGGADVDSTPGFGMFQPCNFSCALRVDTPDPSRRIAYFTVQESSSAPHSIGFDDLSFDVPATSPSYVPVWLGTQGGAGHVSRVQLAQGGTATTPIHVNRYGGSTGDMSYALGALPSGVGASISPTSGADDATITFSANPSATLGDATLAVTVSAPASAGASPQTVDVPITVTRTCQAALQFGVVSATTDNPGFCIDHRPGGDVYITPDGAQVAIDGVQVTPQAGGHLVFSPGAGTISSEGGAVDVGLSGSAFGGRLTLARGPLEWNPGPSATSFALPPFTVSPGASLGGFGALGTAPVTLTPGTAHATVHVALPGIFTATPGGPRVSGDVSFTATNTAPLALDGAAIHVDHAFLGPLELRDVSLSYASSGDVWEGQATLVFPGGASVQIAPSAQLPDGGIGFAGGAFTHAGGLAVFPQGIPIFPGVDITRIGLSLRTSPTVITGTISLAAGHLLGTSLATLDGTMQMAFASPSSPYTLSDGRILRQTGLFTQGRLKLLGRIDLADASLNYWVPDYFEAFGNVHTTLFGIVEVSAGVDLQVNPTTGAFDDEGDARVCIVDTVCAGGDYILSSVGFGGCVRTAIADIGGYFTWDGSSTDFFWHGCDVSDIRANVHAAGVIKKSASFLVTGPPHVLALGIRGTAGAPRFVLTGPNGERIVTPSRGVLDNRRAVILAIAKRKETYVLVANAVPGRWTISTLVGSSPIAGVDVGRALPRPHVSARIVGKSGRRTLRYEVSVPAGFRVQFAAVGDHSRRVLGLARGSRGSLRFTAGTADVPQRETIEAYVFEGTQLRRVLKVASYRAPGAPPLKAPAEIAATRSENGATVTWGSVTGAARYAISLVLSDGRTLSFATSASTRSAHFDDVPSDVTGTFSVVALAASNAASPPAVAQLR